jgi:hypothetical protein
MKIAESKSVDFLFPKSLSTNPNKLTTRSDEARQSSQVDRDFYYKCNRERIIERVKRYYKKNKKWRAP